MPRIGSSKSTNLKIADSNKKISKYKVPLEDSSDELENDEEAQQLIRQAEEKKRAKAKPTEPPTTPKKPSSADHPLTPTRSSPRKTPRKTPNKECYSIFDYLSSYPIAIMP